MHSLVPNTSISCPSLVIEISILVVTPLLLLPLLILHLLLLLLHELVLRGCLPPRRLILELLKLIWLHLLYISEVPVLSNVIVVVDVVVVARE